MKLVLAGHEWKFIMLSPQKFFEQEEDGLASTNPEKKEVYFRSDVVSLQTVRHELFHCYFYSTMVGSANLNSEQTEEVAAELLAEYAEDLVRNSKKVYTWLQKKK